MLEGEGYVGGWGEMGGMGEVEGDEGRVDGGGRIRD